MSGSSGSEGATPDADRVTEAALRARDGDATAAARFVRLTQRDVWRLLVHLADRGVAEDLTQEAYERAFAALPRFRGDAPARTWLLVITRRVAADHVRGKNRRPAVPLPIHDEDRPVTQARHGDLAESVVLQRAIDALEPERREAFVLTQLLGLTYLDAAAVCGCPVGTIRSRVARARQDLVESVGDDASGSRSPAERGPEAGGAR